MPFRHFFIVSSFNIIHKLGFAIICYFRVWQIYEKLIKYFPSHCSRQFLWMCKKERSATHNTGFWGSMNLHNSQLKLVFVLCKNVLLIILSKILHQTNMTMAHTICAAALRLALFMQNAISQHINSFSKETFLSSLLFSSKNLMDLRDFLFIAHISARI